MSSLKLSASNSVVLRCRIIDRCIRNTSKPFPTKQELKEACEDELFGSQGDHICDSTIEKDLFFMRNEHDAPIQYHRTKRGYFYSDSEYTIDEIPLNENDINAIKMAARILDQFKNSPLFENFEFAISKILDRVNISDNINDEEIDNFVQFEKVNKTNGGEHLEKLLNAIKKRNKVQFLYKSFTATEHTVRRVDPYLLKEYNHRWYLIGKTQLKDRIQTFGLDRLSDLEVLSDKFVQNQEFDSDIFFKYSIGITSNIGEPEIIIIETDELLSKYIVSKPLHSSQEFLGKTKDAKYRFQYFLLPTYELKKELLGFGKDLKIIAPDSLAQEVKSIAEQIVNQYQN